MFLDVLRRRNPAFVEGAMRLHQEGKLPANAYVLDLDAVERNARILKDEAARLGMKMFAMTKQVGRASSFCQAVMRGGIDRAVAVDMTCARATHKAGLKLGHLGHLQQVAKFEAAAAAKTFKPDYWTVFNETKAEEASAGAKAAGYTQDLLARIRDEGDTFYRGHEGGFDAGNIVEVADRLDADRWRPLRRHHHFSGVAVRSQEPQGVSDPQSGDARQGRRSARQGRAAETSKSTRPAPPRASCWLRWPRLAQRSASRAMACMAPPRCM